MTGFEHVVEVFDLAQVDAERWEISDKAGRREVLDTILLKRSLSATSLETSKKKPFDIIAKGPILNKSRGDWPNLEPKAAIEPYVATFLKSPSPQLPGMI